MSEYKKPRKFNLIECLRRLFPPVPPCDTCLKSCGETTVYICNLALQCCCENGVIMDTFLEGLPCPHHDNEHDPQPST